MLTSEVSLRKAFTSDGEEVYAIVDFMKNVRVVSPASVWATLKSTPFEYESIKADIKRARVRHVNSRNSYEVDCMTMEGLMNLLLILGSRVADAWRKVVLDAFKREWAKHKACSIAVSPNQVLGTRTHDVLLMHLI